MIIVRLKGGLGNQLFQYAAAKQLSVKYNIPLKLDLSFLEADASDYTKRHYELDKFKINADICTVEEAERAMQKQRGNVFHKTRIREKKFRLYKIKLRTGNNYYLNGYWQSEKYFKDIEDLIRKEFVFKETIDDEYFIRLEQQIVSSNSVSVHFRRTDYITNEKAIKHFEICSLDYYQRAVELLSGRISQLKLFVFSDDIAWVKTHFRTQYPTVFVETSDPSLHSDFRLMSMCKQHIIANSTYSWWAAWLNPDKEKIVIAPRKWYKNKREQWHAADRIPKEWIKI